MKQSIQIPNLSKEMGKQVHDYINSLTKPIGSLGRLEKLAISVAEMKNDPFPVITPPGILVFAADHGITAEGVSAYPSEVTEQMVHNFLSGGAGINVFGRQIGALIDIIDIGVQTDIDHKDLINKKVRYGTRNFLHEDAMTRSEAEESLHVGYTQAVEMINRGAECLILGEMGIGNTTASSALLAVISQKDVSTLVGGGTGLRTEQVQHKINIITQAINNRKPSPADPIDLLTKVGGLEIGGMAGAMLAAAEQRIPILVDGFICTMSAHLAKLISNPVEDYLILTHRSMEPGHDTALQLFGQKPILDLELRLGEGTGAAIAFPIIQSAMLMIKEMATFSSAGIAGKNE